MRPKTLKRSIMLAVALLIVASATGISQIVAHRYGQSLVRAATTRAENISHTILRLSPRTRCLSTIWWPSRNFWTTRWLPNQGSFTCS